MLTEVRDFLRTYPGLEALETDVLEDLSGAACLHPEAAEGTLREYLDGSSLRQAKFSLWVRKGYGGDKGARGDSLAYLENLARWLEDKTRRGDLPDLGEGSRAWSLRASDTPENVLMQEDGLLVDGITLTLCYFVRGRNDNNLEG